MNYRALIAILAILIAVAGIAGYQAGYQAGASAKPSVTTVTLIKTVTKTLTTTLTKMSTLTKTVSAVKASRGFVTERIVIGTTDKITELDPAAAYDFFTWEVLYNIMEGLVKYKPGTDEIVPAIAKSWRLRTVVGYGYSTLGTT